MPWPKEDTRFVLMECPIQLKFISDQFLNGNLPSVHQSARTSTREPPTIVQTRVPFLVTQLFSQELAVSQQLLSIFLPNFSWKNFITLTSFQLPENIMRFSTGPKTLLRKKWTWGREGKTHSSKIIRIVCSRAKMHPLSFHLSAYLPKALQFHSGFQSLKLSWGKKED